jgi:SUMO ligase MMS21 Smc5/6 complex component
MNDQSQTTTSASAVKTENTKSGLRDEILVDVKTANGRITLKKTVRSGMIAIQYND